MSAHAMLSASGAHRWMNCTPSALLERDFPDSTSEYAAEGTLAHEIAELKLTGYFTPMAKRTYNSKLKQFQANPLYQTEMLTHTDVYLHYCKHLAMQHKAPFIGIEKRLDFSSFVSEGFGTGDFICIGGDTLYVVDFKYGRGVMVSAENNPQMMLYGLGALQSYGMFYNIQTVRMTIVQPRLDSISEWEISAADLLDWGNNTVKPLAELAAKGEGEHHPGDWCRFCRAKAVCRARADQHLALEAYGQQGPMLLSDAELGDILTRAQTLAQWASDVEAYVLDAVLGGRDIPGWKAVEGRSTRQFADQDAAFAALLKMGYKEAVLFKRQPITLTAVEKLLGKPDFAEKLADHVIKPPGKPTLAPASDKRPPFNPNPTAAEAFANIN